MPKTIDEWENVFNAFVNNDPNGNGEADEFAFYSHHPDYLYRGNIGWLFGMAEVWSDFFYDDKGKVTYRWLMPQAKECITFLRKAHENKWFPTLMIDDFDTYYPERGNWGKKPIGAKWAWNFQISDELWGGGWVVAPPPKGNTIGRYSIIYPRYWGITKEAEDPELAIKWLDYLLATREGNSLGWWGFEGEQYNIKDGVYFRVPRADMSEALQKKTDNEVCASFGERPRFDVVDTYSTQFADPSVQKTNAAIASFLRVPFPGMMPVEAELDGYNLWRDNEGTAYANEMIIRFIGGEEPLDNWDQFIAQLKKLGVDEITAAKQSMYDRYKKF